MNRKCARCERPADKARNQAYYCFRHYRIKQMRDDAKESGKTVPTNDELERLFDAAEASGLVCEVCTRAMNYVRANGHSTIVSLQHDRDGGYRLICLGCNVRHQNYPGDTFYEVQPDSKRCSACGEIKSHAEFYSHRSNPSGLRSDCKACSKASAMKWIAAKRKAAKA